MPRQIVMLGKPTAPDPSVFLLEIVMLESLPALHDVGYIQPAGAVLVLDGKTEVIVAASANLETRIANWTAPETIGIHARDVLGSAIIHDARNASILPSFERLPEMLGVTNLGVQDIEISVHGADKHTVMEICDAQPEPSALTLVKDLSRLEDRMRDGRDMSEVLCEITGLIRLMSGYDRVQALRLHADGHAVLVSESRRTSVEQAAGTELPWPLDDDTTRLPPYRYVIDAQSPASPVLSDSADDIDLALCHTLMPSPGHLKTLTELGLRSEMIVPLQTDRQVWGALVFQGQRPRIPNPRFTYVCLALAPLLKEVLNSRGAG